MKLKNALLLALTATLLTGCASDTDGILPMPAKSIDPSDALISELTQSYIKTIQGPPFSQYDYVRNDLNGDGLREALILFKGPYNFWCGWSGCTMLLFKAEDNGFTLMSEMVGVRGPFMISNTKTNGWKDLVMRVSGTNIPDRNVVVRYDGTGYPSNPASQTSINIDWKNVPGTRVFP